MKFFYSPSLLFLSLVSVSLVTKAQSIVAMEERGIALRSFYHSLDVENLWQAGQHIDWETGVADKPEATSGIHTHCSAFVAAACKRMGIYILRPPEHKQVLLSNGQYEWLTGKSAADAGWKPILSGNVYENAQMLANRGMVVIAICRNPDEKKPGHVALIMPADISRKKLAETGPVLIMAGTHNHNSVSLKTGFKSHLNGWPEHVLSFYFNNNLPRFSAQ